MTDKNWHTMDLDSVLNMLNTSASSGLSDTEAARRLEEYGPNEIVERKRAGPVIIFLRQFKSPMVLILIAAIIISLFTALVPESADSEGIVDAIVIIAIVFFNAIFGFVQEYRSEQALQKLKQMAVPKTRVLRGGFWNEIEARQLVPGDIVALEAGDRVPADGRVIELVSLALDESILTGEPVPARKTDEAIPPTSAITIGDMKNMVFQGTIVANGKGRMVVTSTGMNTEFGKIAEMVQQEDEETTPLQRDLVDLGKKLAVVVIFLCIIVFAVEVIRNPFGSVMEELLVAIALAVSAIPEGLPAVVTITLAIGVKSMSKKNAIVRRLPSVETLGSTTIIASDKTGTITKNEMTVQMLYVDGRTITVTGSGYNKNGVFLEGDISIDPQQDPHIVLLCKIGQLCSNAILQKDLTGKADWSVLGDPTEGAILVVAEKAGLHQDEIWKHYTEETELTFDSIRKRMTSICRDERGTLTAYCKGAPELLLPLCSQIYEKGSVRPLTPETRQKILDIYAERARNALRMLAFAYRPLDEPQSDWSPEEVERDMIFVGLMAMIDPPRDEAREAIMKCRTAGIRPVMITGDHELTAQAIATRVGLVEKTAQVLRGADLDSIDDNELQKQVHHVGIYARVAPEHKFRIVSALKRNGNVVAMTGDGVNDAPAIKTADVGISMGIRGADVTREASDLILLDDNFATIVSAVEKGREIYSNIRKFVRFLLSANFDEIFLIFTMVMIGLPLPLTPVLILWVNLVTDGFPALALGMDPPEPDVMTRPPRRPDSRLIDRPMAIFVVTTGLLGFVAALITFLWVLITYGGTVPGILSEAVNWGTDIAPTGLPWSFVLDHGRTAVFASIVVFEMLLVWNCRDEHRPVWKTRIRNSKTLMLAVAASVLVILMTIYVPIFQSLFGTVPLYSMDWLVILAVAVPALLIPPHKIFK